MKYLTLFLLIVSNTVQAHEYDEGLWFALFNTKKLSNSTVSLETQVRHSDEDGRISNYILRPSWSISLKEDVQGTIGYLSNFDQDKNLSERRYWAQLNQRYESFQGRVRYELRDWTDSGELGSRLRFMLRYNIEALKISTWTPYVSNEVFWDLKAVADKTETGLNQNRTYIGARSSLTENLSLDTSFLYMYTNRIEGGEDLKTRAIVISATYDW